MITAIKGDASERDVYNLTINEDHSYAVGELGVWSHNVTVFSSGGVKGIFYPGDHGPPHIHIKGEGPEVRVGQAGKPLKGDPELSRKQGMACRDNKAQIRNFLKKVMKNYKSRK